MSADRPDGSIDQSSAEGTALAALPGDFVGIGAEGPFVIRTVFLAREVIEKRATDWRWIFLEDGSLLEIAPKGPAWYRRHRILARGDALCESLVAQDGALVRFEARVRAGTWARRPVRVTVDGASYRVRFTGETSALRLGAEPEPEPWRSLKPEPAANVYFGLVPEADGDLVLGLWTDGVCLSFGRMVDPTDLHWTQGR